MNLAETAFLGKSNKADYHLRWFTPAVEVDLCGHATIASIHFLNENKLLKEGQEITLLFLLGEYPASSPLIEELEPGQSYLIRGFLDAYYIPNPTWTNADSNLIS